VVEHVRRDCTVDNIVTVLRARFGRLPNELNDRLQTLSQGELDRVMVQSATSATLEEALMVALIPGIETSSGGRAADNNRKGK